MSPIRAILSRSRQAISQTVRAADPTLADDEFRISISELNGAAVSYIVVSAEVDFERKSHAGGNFAELLGVNIDTLQSASWSHPHSSPTGSSFQFTMNAIVNGYREEDLLHDDSSLMALQARLQGAVIQSIKQVCPRHLFLLPVSR